MGLWDYISKRVEAYRQGKHRVLRKQRAIENFDNYRAAVFEAHVHREAAKAAKLEVVPEPPPEPVAPPLPPAPFQITVHPIPVRIYGLDGQGTITTKQVWLRNYYSEKGDNFDEAEVWMCSKMKTALNDFTELEKAIEYTKFALRSLYFGINECRKYEFDLRALGGIVMVYYAPARVSLRSPQLPIPFYLKKDGGTTDVDAEGMYACHFWHEDELEITNALAILKETCRLYGNEALFDSLVVSTPKTRFEAAWSARRRVEDSPSDPLQ